MRVQIKHSHSDDHQRRASELAQRIRADRGHEAQLTPGDEQHFVVCYDSDVIFTSQEAGRLPEDEEVLAKIPHKTA